MVFIPPLTALFQTCIALGYVSIQWRTSRVVFVPKIGRMCYTQAKSICPMSPMSFMSFLFTTTERLIDKYIRDETLMSHPLHGNCKATLVYGYSGSFY